MAQTPEELQEYISELTSLADEWKLGKETTETIKHREDGIRKRIYAIADKFNARKRVVLPIPELELQWDRQMAKKAGTGDVSLDHLERILGEKLFKSLCTTRSVSFNFDMSKFLAARESGEITDEMINLATVPAQYGPRLILSKLKVEDDIDEDEYN